MIVKYTCSSCGRKVEEDRYMTPAQPDECAACYNRRVDHRVDHRVENRVDHRVENRVENRQMEQLALSQTVQPQTNHDPSLERERSDAEAFLNDLRSYEITSAAELTTFGEFLSGVKEKLEQLTERMETITKPQRQALDATRALFTPTLDAYKATIDLLKAKILAGQKTIEARNVTAMHTTEAAMLAGDRDTAIAAASSIQSTTLPAGTHTRSGWEYTIVNEALIPREFLKVDAKKLNAYVQKHGGAQAIPGVLIKPKTTLVSR